MSRLTAVLALLLPAFAVGAGNVRVVPVLTAPLCGSCGAIGAGAGLRLDAASQTLGASLLAPALSQPAALSVPLAPVTGAFAPPAAAEGAKPALIIPSRTDEPTRKLFVAENGDIGAAMAAAARQDRAESASAFAEPSAEMMALFDGAKPRDADAAYEPVALAKGILSSPTSSLRGLKQAAADLRAEVGVALPGLSRSVALGGWNGPHTSLDGPCCGDAAPKLAAYLRMRGYPAMLVEAEMHFYVVVRTPEADIVVDPTFRQFFGREKAPASVPQVFVGTWAELSGEFSRHHASKSTGYGVQRIYRSEARGREDLLRAAAAAYEDPAAAEEHGGLRRALSLPRRDTGPQPLIVP